MLDGEIAEKYPKWTGTKGGRNWDVSCEHSFHVFFPVSRFRVGKCAIVYFKHVFSQTCEGCEGEPPIQNLSNSRIFSTHSSVAYCIILPVMYTCVYWVFCVH